MEIVYLNLDKITPYEKNAKLHPEKQVDQIIESIKRFGMNDPIGIWGEKNIIVEGHGRYMALKKMGEKEAPCIRLDQLTDEERREYTLIHNKTTMNSDFDMELLNEELKHIAEMDASIDMSLFDFEIPDVEPESVVDDEYDVKLPKEPISKRGDVYALGRHRLMCGDSTSIDDVGTLMGGKKADLVETDPPYNVAVKSANGLTIQNDDMGADEFQKFMDSAFQSLALALKDGGVFYVWYASKSAVQFITALEKNGLMVKEQLIWVKNHFTIGRQDYQWRHEPCLYGWKDGAGHYFVDDRTQSTVTNNPDKPDFSKMKKEELVALLDKNYENIHTTCDLEARPSSDELHPTMKPIPLIARQVANSSRKGEIVLDLFGGSGTTLIVAEQLARTAYVMEYDPRYVDVIIDRWEKLTGLQAKKMN